MLTAKPDFTAGAKHSEGLRLQVPQSGRASSRRRKLARWANRVNIWPKLELALVLATLGMGAFTYLNIADGGAPINTQSARWVTVLIVASLLPLLGLAFLLMRRIVILWSNRKRGLAGARLHLRLVGFFSLVAIIPTLLVVAFASLLFEFGLQFWFSDRVRTVLDNADQVANAYVIENKARIRDDVIAMRVDLDRAAPLAGSNPSQFAEVVHLQALARDLTEAVVFKVSDGGLDVLVQVQLDQEAATERLPEMAIESARDGKVVVIAGELGDRVQSVARLTGFPDAYLYVSRKAAPQVLDQVAKTAEALSEYDSLLARRKGLQLRFTLVMAAASVLILLAAMWAALWLANRWVSPLGRLIQAAERVGKGELTVRVPVRGSPDELGQLARSFNRMTVKLQAQTGALVTANSELDARKGLIEAVLSGVSAGVLSVSAAGVIGLSNRSAHLRLDLPEGTLDGRRLEDISPDLSDLVDRALADPTASASGLIVLPDSGRSLTVMVHVEPQEADNGDFVLTFDDITDQLADQRRAAWSDVARRIAHEIKNPLTPIQLSAERLKRKYSQEIKTDPDVFTNCTDTIIRQVGDLRRMVDEFSSFARMPRPVFQLENLSDIARQALFLQEISHPDVQFEQNLPDVPLIMICDRRQITQCLTNLVKNALESIAQLQSKGPDAPKSVISVTLNSDGAWTTLSVEDNGIGLPVDLPGNLTEPYVTTRPRGTGLGLAIVKRIVEEHCGRLTLSNRAQGGARVAMTFDTEALRQKQLTAAASLSDASGEQVPVHSSAETNDGTDVPSDQQKHGKALHGA